MRNTGKTERTENGRNNSNKKLKVEGWKRLPNPGYHGFNAHNTHEKWGKLYLGAPHSKFNLSEITSMVLDQYYPSTSRETNIACWKKASAVYTFKLQRFKQRKY